MKTAILARLAQAIPTLLGVTVLVFLFLSLTGDPVRQMLGPEATPEEIRLLRAELRPDRPLPERYVHWLGGVLRGDFGRSCSGKRPVAETIGLLLGTSSGYFGGWWDAVVMRVTDVMLALPFPLLAIAVTAGLGLREETYIDAARVAGAGHARISTAILAEAGLSYLGLGAQPPQPTWGNMLSDGLRDALDPKSGRH